jgi:phosphatidylserine/phosphatidylglycerophosphate/cardiolipin synthase-like enzyme
MNLIRASIAVASILALCTPSRANPAPSIHYAPAENLEHVDVALIDAAKHEIDLAAYILTDWPIIQALTRTVGRKRRVRSLW